MSTLEFSCAERKAFKQTEAKELERHAIETSSCNDLLGCPLATKTQIMDKFHVIDRNNSM